MKIKIIGKNGDYSIFDKTGKRIAWFNKLESAIAHKKWIKKVERDKRGFISWLRLCPIPYGFNYNDNIVFPDVDIVVIRKELGL